MKYILRKFGLFILKVFYPRLYLLEKKQADVGMLCKNIEVSEISSLANIGSPAQIYDSVIGDYTYTSINCRINMTTIGKFCSIGPNLFCGWGIHPTNGLSTSPVFYSTQGQARNIYANSNKFEERKRIYIGNDVLIGMNVTILDGVTIGDGAVIGAGSVVSKNIPPYAVAVGTPIKIIRYRFNENTINDLLRIQWWNFDNEKLIDIDKYFNNIEDFIQKHS